MVLASSVGRPVREICICKSAALIAIVMAECPLTRLAF
jgi:hypothetical protein